MSDLQKAADVMVAAAMELATKASRANVPADALHFAQAAETMTGAAERLLELCRPERQAGGPLRPRMEMV